MLMHYGQFQNITWDLIRETESADTRVTEDDNTRLVSNFGSNAGESFIFVDAEVKGFTQEISIKINGEWKQVSPSVKYLSNWVEPSQIYKKINGLWKRVY